MPNLPEFFTKHRRHIAIGAAAIIFAVVAINVFVYWYFPRYVNPRTPADTIDTLQTSIQITSIVVSLIGSVLLIGTVITALGSISQTQQSLELNREQLRVTQESQITERFTKAIEQLGSDKLAIRLGGIYGLERIAKDSARDHWTVMEVLTAYVRATAIQPEFAVFPDDDPRRKPAPDVQAILTVIARRDVARIASEAQPIDLSGTDLRGAYLAGAHLENAMLNRAWLDQSDLTDAHLQNALLKGTRFEKAEMSRTNLSNARLNHAVLLRANLSKASLCNARLPFAKLSKAELMEADLTGASFVGANFSHASLYSVDLSKSKFEGTDFTGADISKATLTGANLSHAIGLDQVQVDSAIVDRHTKLPRLIPADPSAKYGPYSRPRPVAYEP